MNVSEALRSRRSVRYFGKKEVPEETLRSIVDDAIHAPSWCDAQPWKVYIATGSKALEIRENHRGIAEPGLKGHSDLAAGHREDWGERACANMARLGSEVMAFLGDEEIRLPTAKGISMTRPRLFTSPCTRALLTSASSTWAASPRA